MKPPLPPTPPAAFKLTTTQRRLWRLLELPDAAVAAGGIERVKRAGTTQQGRAAGFHFIRGMFIRAIIA